MAITAQQVKSEARRLGFLTCGVTDLAPAPHGDELDRWLAAGYAGTMRYLHRQARKRKSPQLIDRDATRVVVVLDNYFTPDTAAERTAPRVAKYARGEDYHRVTVERLDRLAAFLRQHGAAVARTYSDTGPVPERELAQRAGLGWIGKNTMLIRPDAGSFCFIGSVFTDLTLAVDPPFELERCGSCTRCLEACPTQAFVEPHVLDATRCISYLTIEQRGPIPPDLAPRLEGWVFGCDICNDVCPWNERFATETQVPEFRPQGWLRGADAHFFDDMTDVEFGERFGATALARPGLAGMRRNLHAGLGSRAEPR